MSTFRSSGKRRYEAHTGAAQHEVVRCRTGIVIDTEFAKVPDQRRTANAPHRVRHTLV
jgi:hypothetical protein